jgi:hypothetical protein
MAFTVTSTRMHQMSDSTMSGTPAVIVTKRLVSDTQIDLLVNPNYDTVATAAFGNLHSSLYATPTDMQRLGRHRLRTVQVQPVEGSDEKVFDCVARYDTMYVWQKNAAIADGTPAFSELYLPLDVEFQSTPRQALVHRSKAFGTNPAINLNTTTDIGGTKVDTGGKPIVQEIRQQRVRISFIYDSARSASSQSVYHAQGEVDAAASTWNSAQFLWFPANKLLCESGSVAHVRDEFYRVTFNFLWDEWFLCEQIPARDPYGLAAQDVDSKAKTVFWKSITRSTYNVTSIFNQMGNATLAKRLAYWGSIINPGPNPP